MVLWKDSMCNFDGNFLDSFENTETGQAELNRIVSLNRIVLFMKGDRRFPVCGLSSTVCFMLKRCNLKFLAIDLLTNPSLALFLRMKHEPISAPYLYVGGKFVGGYETVCTMFDSGLLNNIAQTSRSDQKQNII